MASFYDLPNEIVIRIWQHVLRPDDIESFGQVSRGVYALAAPFLAAHKELQAKYTTYNNGVLSTKSWSPLLRELCINPHHGYYVHTLHVDGWLRRFNSINLRRSRLGYSQWQAQDGSLLQNSDQIYVAGDLDLFVEAAKSTATTAILRQMIESGSEEPILALIIMHLPNLRRLIIDPGMDDQRRYPSFSSVMREASYLWGPTYNIFPPHLKNVVIHHGELELVRQFAGIHSVRTVSCIEGGPHQSGANTTRGPSGPFEIPEFSFQTCTFRSMEMADLIASTRNLETFRVNDIPSSEGFDAAFMVATLYKHARHTLKKLVVHSRSRSIKNPDNSYLGSFLGFTVLEELDTDFAIFKFKGSSKNDDAVAVLPTSIVTLRLREYFGTRGEFAHFIQTLLDAKTTRLPLLRCLQLEVPWVSRSASRGEPWISNGDLKAMCEQRGVQLEL